MHLHGSLSSFLKTYVPSYTVMQFMILRASASLVHECVRVQEVCIVNMKLRCRTVKPLLEYDAGPKNYCFNAEHLY